MGAWSVLAKHIVIAGSDELNLELNVGVPVFNFMDVFQKYAIFLKICLQTKRGHDSK